MAILSLMQFMLWMGLCGMWVLYTHVYAESIYGADKETAPTDNFRVSIRNWNGELTI